MERVTDLVATVRLVSASVAALPEIESFVREAGAAVAALRGGGGGGGGAGACAEEAELGSEFGAFGEEDAAHRDFVRHAAAARRNAGLDPTPSLGEPRPLHVTLTLQP